MEFDETEFYRFAAAVLGVDAVDADTSYGSIPEWDSVQHLRLVMEVQARYGIDIPLEAVPELKTLGQFAHLAANRQSDNPMTIVYPVKRGLYVNLTNACDCDCMFCLRHNAPGVYGSPSLWLERDPTIPEILAALESRNLADFSELVFCGYGEPTMRLDALLATARRAREIRPDIHIRLNTNGLANLFHGRNIAPDLAGLVDEVSISLNSSDPEKYVELCRPAFGAASHPALIEFAKLCMPHIPYVGFTIVGPPVSDDDEIARCLDIAQSVGAHLRIRKYEEPSQSNPTKEARL